MSIEDRVKATTDGLQGQAKQAIGEITGDQQLQAEGKIDQLKSKVGHAAADVKDQAESLTHQAADLAEDLKDKAVDTISDLTDKAKNLFK